MMKRFVYFFKVAVVLFVIFLMTPNDIETIESDNALVYVYKAPVYSVWEWHLYAPGYYEGYKLDHDLHWFFEKSDHFKEKFQTYRLTVIEDYYNIMTFKYNNILAEDEHGIRYQVNRGHDLSRICVHRGDTIEVVAIERLQIDQGFGYNGAEYDLPVVEVTSLGNHRWGEWHMTQSPTCAKTGQLERVCGCGETETDDIPTEPHLLRWRKVPNATPEEQGMYIKYCERCDSQIERRVITSEGSLGLSYLPDYYSNTCMVTGIGSCRDSVVRIPEYFDTMKITAIDDYAFQECNSITEVIMPDCITEIGKQAFYKCDNLIKIHFSSSVRSIGNFAFSHCPKLTEIHLPDTLIEIGECAFSDNDLQSVILSQNLKTIDRHAFGRNPNLKSIIIPNSVIEIREYAFVGCSLESLELPDSILNLQYSALNGLSELRHVSLPEKIKTITQHMLSGCIKLQQITLPQAVTDIEKYAFSNCHSLENITIGSNVTFIANHAFSRCSRLNTIHYNGTISQWNNIFKVKGWNSDSAISVIRCTDGDIII